MASSSTNTSSSTQDYTNDRAQPPTVSDQRNRMKDQGREVRLSFRNFAEHQLRREFREELLSDPKKCAIPLKAFAECSKQEGLKVVWKCQDFKAAVNECMSIYNSPQAWEAYKELHKDDLDNRVISTDAMKLKQQTNNSNNK